MDSSILTNIDLLTVGTVVAATFVLGFTTYLSDTKNKTNLIFLLLAITTGLWGMFNYFGYKILNQDLALWFLRLTMFLAVWQAYFIFKMFSLFPKGEDRLGKIGDYILLTITLFTSAITLTPAVFHNIASTYDNGRISSIANGELIPLFGIVSISFVLTGIIIMLIKTKRAKPAERSPFALILSGTIITFSFIIAFNFLMPAFLNDPSLIPFGALFTFPIIFLTAHAFSKGVLNVKVLSTSVLVFFLSIITFFEVLFTTDIFLLIFRSLIFGLIILFGLLLIKSVLKEVRQREEIEKLASDLTNTNDQLKFANDKLKELSRQKTEFVSIASHQLRSPLTAIKGYSSMLLEGSFGELTDKTQTAIDVIFQSSQKLITIIEDFLNITRLELGQMKYEMSVFDFGELTQTVINNQKPNIITQKGLTLEFQKGPEGHQILTDKGKITQVISNLIDNAIKYTPTGWIKIKMENIADTTKKKKREIVRLSITDSGIGIEKATMSKLFGKFVRADDAGKTNITGTGLGLYVAKQIVESLKGKIWAESLGKDKGSTFFVEFPRAKGGITQTEHKIEAYTKKDFSAKIKP